MKKVHFDLPPTIQIPSKKKMAKKMDDDRTSKTSSSQANTLRRQLRGVDLGNLLEVLSSPSTSRGSSSTFRIGGFSSDDILTDVNLALNSDEDIIRSAFRTKVDPDELPFMISAIARLKAITDSVVAKSKRSMFRMIPWAEFILALLRNWTKESDIEERIILESLIVEELDSYESFANDLNYRLAAKQRPTQKCAVTCPEHQQTCKFNRYHAGEHEHDAVANNDGSGAYAGHSW